MQATTSPRQGRTAVAEGCKAPEACITPRDDGHPNRRKSAMAGLESALPDTSLPRVPSLMSTVVHESLSIKWCTLHAKGLLWQSSHRVKGIGPVTFSTTYWQCFERAFLTVTSTDIRLILHRHSPPMIDMCRFPALHLSYHCCRGSEMSVLVFVLCCRFRHGFPIVTIRNRLLIIQLVNPCAAAVTEARDTNRMVQTS
jgi:hypothetical protein